MHRLFRLSLMLWSLVLPPPLWAWQSAADNVPASQLEQWSLVEIATEAADVCDVAVLDPKARGAALRYLREIFTIRWSRFKLWLGE